MFEIFQLKSPLGTTERQKKSRIRLNSVRTFRQERRLTRAAARHFLDWVQLSKGLNHSKITWDSLSLEIRSLNIPLNLIITPIADPVIGHFEVETRSGRRSGCIWSSIAYELRQRMKPQIKCKTNQMYDERIDPRPAGIEIEPSRNPIRLAARRAMPNGSSDALKWESQA